jgi:ATP-binding cassette subfamily C protein LapB
MNLSELRGLVAEGARQIGEARAALRAMPQPGAGHAGGTLPSAATIYADIVRIADRWSGRAGTQVPPPEVAPVTADGLVDAAARIGLDVHYEPRTLKSLGQGDFPCILLFTDASTCIAVRGDKGTIGIIDRERVVDVPAEALGESFAGLVYRVRTRPQATPALDLDSERAAAPPPLLRASTLLEEVKQLTLVDQRPLVIYLLIAAGLSNLLTLALPLFTMAVYDRVVPHMAIETLWALAIGAVIALGIDLAIRHIRLRMHDAVALSATVSLQSGLYRRLVLGRLDQTPRTAGGMTGALRDLENLCQTVPGLFVAVVVDLPFFLLVLLLMASIAGWVVVVPILGVLAIVAVHLHAHRVGHNAALDATKLAATQTNQLIETVAALERVKSTGAERLLKRRWEALADATNHASHEARIWMSFSNQVTLVATQFVIVGVVIVGVYGIGAGTVTLGSLTASTLLVGRAIAPVGQLVSLVFRLKHVLEQAAPLERFLASPVEQAGDAGRLGKLPADWTIACKGLTFAYEKGARPTLDNLDITIQPGERVGIIGRNGCGKSTLLRLIQRLHEPTGGALTLGGADIRQFDPRLLRAHIGVMPQDAALFDESLRANMVLGLDQVDEAAFREAAAISGVAGFADRHPKGYDLPVGPRGERLSGGERQTVLLARALLTGGEVLILDEPTAAMDPTLETAVIRRLKDALGRRTVLIATHRTAILDLVDRIIWLDNGRILADGPKAEILRQLQRPAA